jgi:dolichyl-phosphate-mannose-protein mannosyltransferase
VTVPFGKRELAIIAAMLLLAFFVRFAFFSNQGYAAIDTNDFKAWFGHAADVGIRSFYSNNYWCDYPPLNIYFFWIFGLIAKSLGVLGSNLFTYVMKLPANLIDIATAFLIFAFVRKRLSFNWALLATALYAFNPAVIFDAAVWGQFDAIYTFLLVLSLFLVFSSKPKLAVVAYMLGVLTKPQSIALAPLFFYLIWRKTDWKGLFTSVLVAAATIFVVILPFEWSDPVNFLSNLYFGAYNGYKYTTLNAFNVWGFGGMWVADTTTTFLLGWAMFALLSAFAVYFVHKHSEKNYELAVLLAAFVLFFGFFMLPTRIHERYLFPAIAILALMFPFLKKTRPLYVVLTITCFINQAYVLSFLNAGTFIQLGDPLVFIISLLNSIALLYVLALMFRDLPKSKQTAITSEKPTPGIEEKLPEPQLVPDEPESNKRIYFPKLNKRDWITILALSIIFFSMATYNLGATQSPITQTPLYAGQTFYLDLGNQSNTGSIFFLIHDGSYNVSVYTGSPGTWQSASENRSFSDYYKWNEVSLGRTTRYIRVDLLSASDAAFEEIAISDSNHQQIPILNATGLNSTTTDLHALYDEQDKVQMPFTYMAQTYFDEIYFVRTAEQYLHLQSPYEWTHPPLGKLIPSDGGS